MTPGEITAMLSNINSIQHSLDEASGKAVMVETRMRLIGELSQTVQNTLKNLVTQSKRKGKSSDYWDCDLSFLDDALGIVFQTQLEVIERQKIVEFRNKRNALLHGDFVSLMKLIGISPTGRKITNGKRNMLESKNIKEAILSIDKNQGFQKLRTQASEIITLLDKIIHSLAIP